MIRLLQLARVIVVICVVRFVTVVDIFVVDDNVVDDVILLLLLFSILTLYDLNMSL